MNTKHAILNSEELNGHYSLMAPVDYRAPRNAYEHFYTKEQIEYLFEHKLIQKYEPCYASWEHPNMGEYWEFTDKGKRLRKWYASSLKTYLYYEVFHLYNLKIYWQKFRIWCGHHYDWQDYIGVDINDI